MPASALLKFTQGATVGGDGRALVGVLTTSVAISNVSNTSVASWQIEIAYVDPTSALAASPTIYAFNENSSTPSANFTPDVRRSYRWVLKVWSVPNRVGDPDSIDIRVFTVRELNGVIIPPGQVWPLPLPDPRTGDPTAKPPEMNFDGQLEGWHGTGTDGLMNQVLAKHLPPVPGSNGDVLTVVSGRWLSVPPPGVGSGDVTGPASSVDNNIVLWDGTSGKAVKDSGLSLSAFIRHNGSVAFTGSQSMGGFRITNSANAVAAGDLVTLAQLQSAINGLDPKGNVRAYTTTNIAALSGLGALTGSGVASFTDGQRIALGGQTTATQNGPWVVHAGAWTRPADFDTGMDVSGAYFFVEEGTFAERGYLVTSDTGSAVVGTNNLVLQDFGSSSISAGNGLQKVGNVISIAHDGGTLVSSGSGLKVATGGITGTELATGAVDLATNKVTGLLPFSNIANGAAASLLGRSANSIGVMASIASSADGQVLRRAGGVLGFGAVDLADTDAVAGLLPVSNLANLTGLSVLGRSANTLGVMAAITGTADLVLAVNTAGTALAFGQVQTGGLANGSVTLAKHADSTDAASVLGRAGNTTGPYADIASSADGQVLRRAGGILAFGAIDLADTDAVTGLLPVGSLAAGSALSVLGRAGNTAGAMASIVGAADQTLVVNTAGTALAFGQLQTGGIANSAVTLAKLANAGASSVLGRSAATTGPYADILSSADGQVLRRGASGVIAFGAVDLTDADAVTGALPAANGGTGIAGAGGTANRVLVTTDGSSWSAAQVALATMVSGLLPLANLTGGSAVGQVLRNTAGNVPAWGAVDLADTDAVTGLLPLANVANGAARSVLGRSANTVGVQASIAGGGAGTVLVDNGTTLSFSTLGTTSITDGAVTLAKLANGSASSVLGRSAATAGVYADILSSADGQVLRRGASGVVAFGAVDLADADAVTGLLSFSNVSDGAPRSVLARAANTAGILAPLAGGGAGTVLVDNGTTLGFTTIGTTSIADGAVTLAKLTNAMASSVLGRSAATAGVYADIASSADGQVLRRGASGVIAFGAVDLADADAVTGQLPYSSIASGSARSVLGRAANSAGALADIAGTGAGRVLIDSGTALAFSDPNFGARNITTTGQLRLGATPSNVGAICLSNAFAISARNVANTGDVSLIYLTGSNTVEIGSVTSTISLGAGLTSIGVTPSTDVLTFYTAGLVQAVIGAGYMSLGATPATAGLFRMPNNQSVKARNVANSGDIDLLSLSASDGVVVGGTGAASVSLFPGAAAMLVLSGTNPATTGTLRSPHNATVIAGRNNSNSVDRSLLRWGTTTDFLILGDPASVSLITGSSVQMAFTVGSPMFELASLATNREVISLFRGAAITTTQMTAGTGDGVVFWGDATTMPTTGFPVSGGILGVDTSLGLEWKGKNGVETTIAPHGDSGNTTKRRWIDWKSRPTLSTITGSGGANTVTGCTFDATNFNGATLSNASLSVKARYIARDATSGYATTTEILVYVDVIGGAVTAHGLTDSAAASTFNGAPVNAVVDVSGTTVRLRLTGVASAGYPAQVWSFFEVTGYEQ